jgi:hypothetical protein
MMIHLRTELPKDSERRRKGCGIEFIIEKVGDVRARAATVGVSASHPELDADALCAKHRRNVS